MKNLLYLVSFCVIAILLVSCSAAGDKTVRTHTIANCKNYVTVIGDTLSRKKLDVKLKAGDKVFWPEKMSENWVRIYFTEYGAQHGYIHPKYIVSDTTIIKHSNVLREEYGQEIIPDLDEKYDSIVDAYLDFFPIKEAGFWTLTIIIAIGIALFYGISDVKVPLGAQLIAIIIYSPFATWMAFIVQRHGFVLIDGFFLRLIILLAMLVLAVLMITGFTASIGKLIGHSLTFKYSILTTCCMFLIYLGIAYIHSLSDFFFKVTIFVYAIFFICYIVNKIKEIKSIYRFCDSSCLPLVIKDLLFAVAIFIGTTIFISVVFVPMQIVSSILVTELTALIMTVIIVGLSILSFGHNPGYPASDSSERVYVPGVGYAQKDSSGYYYDHANQQYEEIGGVLRRVSDDTYHTMH